MYVCSLHQIVLYIYIYIVQFDGDSNWSSRHNILISAENITILSVSSDDYLHASLSLQSCKCGVTVRIQKMK